MKSHMKHRNGQNSLVSYNYVSIYQHIENVFFAPLPNFIMFASQLLDVLLGAVCCCINNKINRSSLICLLCMENFVLPLSSYRHTLKNLMPETICCLQTCSFVIFMLLMKCIHNYICMKFYSPEGYHWQQSICIEESDIMK